MASYGQQAGGSGGLGCSRQPDSYGQTGWQEQGASGQQQHGGSQPDPYQQSSQQAMYTQGAGFRLQQGTRTDWDGGRLDETSDIRPDSHQLNLPRFRVEDYIAERGLYLDGNGLCQCRRVWNVSCRECPSNIHRCSITIAG